jgi:copper oxidase (laccase) domain-containing protein
VVADVRQAFGRADDGLLQRVNGGFHLDLWAATARDLREAGVGQIEQAGLCTVCHADEFFSHRAHGAVTGRFAALIGLR